MKKLFITSTGTGIGKTFVTCMLITELREQGYSVSALKPVISGFKLNDKDGDEFKIIKALGLPYNKNSLDLISAYRFKEPTSPDICARKDKVKIKISKILELLGKHKKSKPDIILIEGVGGVMVPFSENKTVADLIKKSKAETVLVAGNYLGTISHTLTAISALKAKKVKVKAIVVSESLNKETINFAELKKTLGNFTSANILYLPRKLDKKHKKQFINSFLNVIS